MTERSPAVALAISFLAGIALPRPVPSMQLALAALLLAGACLCALRARLALGSLLALAAFAALGGSAAGLREEARRTSLVRVYESLPEARFEAPSEVSGRLRREPELGPETAVVVVEVESLRVGRDRFPVEGGVRASVHGEERRALRRLDAGDRVALWVKLRRPAKPRNPGGFDAFQHFQRRRIDLVGTVKSALLVSRTERSGRLRSFLSRLRRGALSALEASLGERDPSLGVVAALVTGDRSRLTTQRERVFQRAGVFHVMAISGAHVAILAFAVYGLLRRAGMDEAPALACLLVLLPLYAAFCGGRPPVVRAVVMASAVLVARLLSLDRPRANALGLGALALLVWDPSWLGDAGFQLSFAAMAAIVGLFDRARTQLDALGRLGPPLAVSLSAQAGVVPVAAWHFLRMAPLAPVASLAAIPLAGAVILLGLLLVVASLVPGLGWLSAALVGLTRVAVALLCASAEIFARLPFAALDVARPAPVWIAGYVASLALWRAPSPRAARAGVAASVALVLALVPGTRSSPGELVLTALSVGHGDAIVLRLPGGRDVLVDGGGAPGSSFDVGASIVLPALRALGIRSLDAVVVTHTDLDHLGGLLSVVEEMPVDEIWEGPPRLDRAAYRGLRARAERRDIPFRRLSPGERFVWGGVRWEILAAGGVGGLEPLANNDRSLVMRIVHGRIRVLLTGDAERGLESELLREPARLEADVLKVAHHGSRSSTSPEFLLAVRPRLAIVSGQRSAGRPLPSLEVLQRLRDRGIPYLRTDESGAVTLRMNAAGEIRVATFRESS